MNKRSFVFR